MLRQIIMIFIDTQGEKGEGMNKQPFFRVVNAVINVDEAFFAC